MVAQSDGLQGVNQAAHLNWTHLILTRAKPVYALDRANLNRSGRRESYIYGKVTIAEIGVQCRNAAWRSSNLLWQTYNESQPINWYIPRSPAAWRVDSRSRSPRFRTSGHVRPAAMRSQHRSKSNAVSRHSCRLMNWATAHTVSVAFCIHWLRSHHRL